MPGWIGASLRVTFRAYLPFLLVSVALSALFAGVFALAWLLLLPLAPDWAGAAVFALAVPAGLWVTALTWSFGGVALIKQMWDAPVGFSHQLRMALARVWRVLGALLVSWLAVGSIAAAAFASFSWATQSVFTDRISQLRQAVGMGVDAAAASPAPPSWSLALAAGGALVAVVVLPLVVARVWLLVPYAVLGAGPTIRGGLALGRGRTFSLFFRVLVVYGLLLVGWVAVNLLLPFTPADAIPVLFYAVSVLYYTFGTLWSLAAAFTAVPARNWDASGRFSGWVSTGRFSG